MGIPRKAVKRAAKKALVHGVDQDACRGWLRAYILRTIRKSPGARKVKVLGNHVFIFGEGDNLVTLWPVSGGR